MKVAIIAALSEDGTIGDKGTIPWHITEDLKRFKKLTMGRAVIMGRKTFESIGKPLPGRTNIVLSRNQAFRPDGVLVFADLTQALKHLAALNSPIVFIIGGAEVYRQALPLADTLLLTHVHRRVAGDTKFPGYDRSQWTETARQDFTEYTFVEYSRKHHG